MINVLVTACGCPGGPGLIRALKEEYRVVGTDCSATASGRHFADAFYEVPRGGHPDFIRDLLEICSFADIDVVLPESSHEVMALAEARTGSRSAASRCWSAIPERWRSRWTRQ